jgi:hypothetical protein
LDPLEGCVFEVPALEECINPKLFSKYREIRIEGFGEIRLGNIKLGCVR